LDKKTRQKSYCKLNIIITGASGFIGYPLVKALSKDKNYEVVAITRSNSDFSKIKNLNVEIVKCDILDKNLRKKISNEIDVIIHLAAIRQYYISKELIYKTNVLGTKNLLKCFKDAKHFIFASTSIINFQNHYANSKKKCEEIIKNSGINYSILRIGPVYGLDDNTGISRIIKSINAEKQVPVPGDGKFEIQPIHVDDVVNAIITVIMNRNFFNNTWNMVGKPIFLSDFINEVCKILNKKNKSIHIPYSLLKIIAKIYENISSNPRITVEQLDILIHGSKFHSKSHFRNSPLEITIKKSV